MIRIVVADDEHLRLFDAMQGEMAQILIIIGHCHEVTHSMARNEALRVQAQDFVLSALTAAAITHTQLSQPDKSL